MATWRISKLEVSFGRRAEAALTPAAAQARPAPVGQGFENLAARAKHLRTEVAPAKRQQEVAAGIQYLSQHMPKLRRELDRVSLNGHQDARLTIEVPDAHAHLVPHVAQSLRALVEQQGLAVKVDHIGTTVYQDPRTGHWSPSSELESDAPFWKWTRGRQYALSVSA